jgi:hypothetical protein
MPPRGNWTQNLIELANNDQATKKRFLVKKKHLAKVEAAIRKPFLRTVEWTQVGESRKAQYSAWSDERLRQWYESEMFKHKMGLKDIMVPERVYEDEDLSKFLMEPTFYDDLGNFDYPRAVPWRSGDFLRSFSFSFVNPLP